MADADKRRTLMDVRAILVTGLAACASAPAPKGPEPQLKPPALRLPDDARPVRAAVELTIAPSAPGFAGTASIELAVARPVRVLWLNATHLEVASAQLSARGRTLPARIVPGGNDFVGFALPEEVPAGPATLVVSYRGVLSRKDDTGLFAETVGADSYVFSQFEHCYAREAFPSYDEPAYKIPWRLTLHVPKDDAAVSNTAIESEHVDGELRTVVFGETKPLPSYLVALAVGPFELLDAGTTHAGVPLRVVVPRGLADQAAYARANLGAVIDALERFLGTPFPYAKLDLVAVPQMGGAMENAGMITSFVPGVLRRPDEEDVGFRQGFVELMAHEGGHQWFGDLVTMAWWDDIWLNESFAEWVQVRIAETMHPEWRAFTSRVRNRNAGMAADAQIAARRIRQPIVTMDDIANAFDGITYSKGATVLHMFERWLGSDTLRDGMRRHFAAHAYGTATASEFLASVSAAAGHDVAPAFATFLDASGVPEVRVGLDCSGGAVTLRLAQQRYLPLGSAGSAAQTWKVPVCLRWGTGTAVAERCLLLEDKERAEPLGGACPEWLVANAEGTGYYVPIYEGDLLERLAQHVDRLTVPEQRALLDDLGRLMAGGRTPARRALGLITALARSDDPIIAAGAAANAALDHTFTVSDADRPAYQRFLVETFGARARALGWQPRPGENEDTRKLRTRLLGLVADVGQDPELVREGRRLAEAWIAGDHKAIHPDVVPTALTVAAHVGDRALFDKVRARLAVTADVRDRGLLLRMLGGFRDPKLLDEALGLLVDPSTDAREVGQVRWGATVDRVNGARTYAWIRDHFDAVRARTSEFFQQSMFYVGGMCDEESAARVERELGERARTVVGAPHVLAEDVESIRLCAAARTVEEPEVKAFLSTYRAARK
jgi:alanyl aminopeptidase